MVLSTILALVEPGVGGSHWSDLLHPRNFISTFSAPFKTADNGMAVIWSIIVLSPIQHLGWKTIIWNPMLDQGSDPFFRIVCSIASWVVFLLACLWPLGTHYTDQDGAEPHLYSSVTLMALGYYFVFGAVTLNGYLCRIILNSSRRYRGFPPVNRTRYAVVIWSCIVAIYAQHVAKGYSPLVARQVEMKLPNWPECLNGYKIALLSDTHIGPAIGRQNVMEVVELVQKQNAQLILLAGDIADGPPSMRAKAVEPLTQLRAADGVYYVTGNHDYMHGSTGHDWIRWFHESGSVEPMINKKVVLPKVPPSDCGGEIDTFQLLGVPDYTANPDFDKVWNTTRSEDGPTVLLSHQPNQWRSARKAGVDLQVSGHTHGGHWFPWTGMVYLCNVAIAGKALWPPTQSQLYITDGVFAWGARLRLPTSDNAVDILTLSRLPENEELEFPWDFGSLIGGLTATAIVMMGFGIVSATRRGISWTAFCYSLGLTAVAYVWRHLWWNHAEALLIRFAHHNNIDN